MLKPGMNLYLQPYGGDDMDTGGCDDPPVLFTNGIIWPERLCNIVAQLFYYIYSPEVRS